MDGGMDSINTHERTNPGNAVAIAIANIELSSFTKSNAFVGSCLTAAGIATWSSTEGEGRRRGGRWRRRRHQQGGGEAAYVRMCKGRRKE